MRVCSICRRCYDDVVFSCADGCHSELCDMFGTRGMVAGYRLDVFLESGTAGEMIYRAEHEESGRTCVVKILTAKSTDAEQFLRDAEIAASLFHPGVVDVYDSGTLETGELFLVTEDADGQTLREFLDTVEVPQLLTAIQVARQAAEALHALHLKGLIHRAIRPENIILTSDVEHRLLVRIAGIDLGGVAERSTISNKLLIDSALGSIRYFAPEQCSGDPACLKTDVYSLGVVMYEMLSGTPPFDAPTAAGLIEQHRKQRPPDISIADFELRMLIAHTLMESLRKRPEKRQSSANAFARQLRHIEQLATHVSTPPPAGAMPPAPPSPVFSSPGPAPAQPASVRPVPAAVGLAIGDPAPRTISSATTSRASAAVAPAPVVPGSAEPATARVSRMKMLRKKLHPKAPVPAEESGPVPAGRPVQASKPEASQKRQAAPLTAQPLKIEWEQPEDDIPTIEDVREVLLQEPNAAVRSEPQIVAPRMEQVPRVMAPAIKHDEVKAVSQKPKAVTKAVRVEPAKPSTATALTTRPAQVRVAVKRPPASPKRAPERPAASRSGEVLYSPTLLGGNRKHNDSSVMAFYGTLQTAVSAVPRRSLMTAGGGTAALAVLFLFGSYFVGSSSRIPENAEGSISAGTIPAQSSLPQQTEQPGNDPAVSSDEPDTSNRYSEQLALSELPQPLTASTAKKPAMKDLDSARAQEKVAVSASKTAMEAKSPATPAIAKSSAALDRKVAKMPSVASTLVISYRKNPPTESEDRTNDKDRAASQSRSLGPTRPRIVKNPKP